MEAIVNQYRELVKGKPTQEVLKLFFDKYGDSVSLSSSLGVEDQVLTDIMHKIRPKVKIFSLDTGRLPSETYDLIERTNQHYNLKIKLFYPNTKKIEEWVNTYGPNAFYQSPQLRKSCCFIRKVEPLKRALSGLKVWVTGLRKEQSITRQGIEQVDFDHENQLIKLNPLCDWSEDQVWEYVQSHGVPVSSLYKQGYKSIGCSPCSRPVKFGEDVRSGRWWWENPEKKECGLHISSHNHNSN